MSGFLLHTVTNKNPSSLPWPVSFGRGQAYQEYVSGKFRLAVRPVVRESGTGFVRMKDGHLWYEGEPRPRPNSSMTLEQWLKTVDGGFRAVFFFEDGSVAVIADPYCSRPLFVSDGQSAPPCASDKLVSLTACEPALGDLRWDIMLEALALGCVLSRDTSLKHVTELEAGTYVKILPDQTLIQTRYCRHPMDEVEPAHRSIVGDAWSLGRAMKRTVADLAPDPDVTILLSGGFDSRWVARLLGPNRPALTVASGECLELTIAREIAKRCGDTHTTHLISPDKWRYAVKYGHLITGGLFNPLKNHFLADAEVMAANGVTSVLHAHLFDTAFKGYFVYPPEQFVPPPDSLFPPMSYMTGGIIFTSEYLASLSQVLSPEGRRVLAERMKLFHDTTPSRVTRGYEFGLEARVLRNISRLMDMPMGYNLMEHFEVKATIFHRSLWQWWRASQAEHRKPCTAFLLAVLSTARSVALVQKGDTGEYLMSMLGRGLLRSFLPVGEIKKFLTHLRGERQHGHSPSSGAPPAGWGVESTVAAMYEPAGRAVLEEGLAAVSGEPIFQHSQVDGLAASLKSKIQVDPHLICFLSSLGWFKKSVLEGIIPSSGPAPETRVDRTVV